ncbi:DNA recombination protein RmuC [candidate division WWE3 bacterium CG09_land_8_20_14_0_10_39_24]|uniref:DNA recombination protein RmuC n=2 Tax=Katanobacteria TaxID=422282 RepID=A0A2G9XCS5_UNCKA|nr:MAG: recombinase RmuC [bacterium CG2_30_40_12]PIP04769.1 MAG: DNA recombination protein RmuC [candidate division WWE3 bacterium CG23_combo_of_CG06-09_8_20_14_all_40_14]PIS12792.1 MAG: DNA recombination protein RmuC [candidate division WWE3 bacterium CG09_land_8_20_14_0_10_39_24]PJE50815.1 MAG: DNA recombination protein RmuC [candidate division WWE3 bacterium CG10_big_fil_rev_8_21_14_0_10_39_14]
MLLETVLLIILSLVNLFLLFILINKKGEGKSSLIEQSLSNLEKLQERTEKAVKDEMSTNRTESSNNEKRTREEISNLFKGLSTTVERRLENIQKDNSEKLEKMRATVDERLHETLEKRLGEKFKLVSNQLEQVYKGLGEMQTLASGVGDLKKVLSNIKTRGVWGEVQLEILLSQMLTAEQYEKNIATKKGSNDRVEFAIKMPGRSEESPSFVYLPIDAKFPLEDYEKIQKAKDKSDIPLIEQLTKSLENRIKDEAKTIKEKYIDPPHTTDYGILYLPMEGLFAEVLGIPGLSDKVQRVYRVTIAGPTTISAMLNSLQMGFRTFAIEKRTSVVWELLGSIKTEFGIFADLLDKTHKKLEEASHTIESASSKSRTIERKLNKVQELPDEKSFKRLPSA